jgi:DeoR/GlpR family transcriptional regulator of sugar metabolism
MLTNMEELGTKRAIAKTTPETIVLADHDKFDRGAFLKVWDFGEISRVITGVELPDEVYERYTELGLTIERV